MVIEKRPQRYVETNSNPNRSKVGNNTITKFLREVGSSGTKVLQRPDRSKATSTGGHVQVVYGKKSYDARAIKERIIDTRSIAKSFNAQRENENMRTRSGQVKIKQELIEVGIENKQSNRTNGEDLVHTNSKTIEVMDISSDDELETAMDEEQTDTGNVTSPITERTQIDATQGIASKRTWNTNGSRKKPKQYYRDVRKLSEKTSLTSEFSPNNIIETFASFRRKHH